MLRRHLRQSSSSSSSRRCPSVHSRRRSSRHCRLSSRRRQRRLSLRCSFRPASRSPQLTLSSRRCVDEVVDAFASCTVFVATVVIGCFTLKGRLVDFRLAAYQGAAVAAQAHNLVSAPHMSDAPLSVPSAPAPQQNGALHNDQPFTPGPQVAVLNSCCRLATCF